MRNIIKKLFSKKKIDFQTEYSTEVEKIEDKDTKLIKYIKREIWARKDDPRYERRICLMTIPVPASVPFEEASSM